MTETPVKSSADLQSDHKKFELSGNMKPEPLLMENPGRFVLFPIQHEDVSTPYPRGRPLIQTLLKLRNAMCQTHQFEFHLCPPHPITAKFASAYAPAVTISPHFAPLLPLPPLAIPAPPQ